MGIFKKLRRGVRNLTSGKVGRILTPLATGAVPYLVARGAVEATGGGRRSIVDRARGFGRGAAGGTADYLRNPVVRAAGEVLPGVKPVARATERAADFTQRALTRGSRVSAREALGAATDAAGAYAGAAGIDVPPKIDRVLRKGAQAAEAIERGSRARAHLRRARAAAKAIERPPKKKRSKRRRKINRLEKRLARLTGRGASKRASRAAKRAAPVVRRLPFMRR